VKLLTWQVTAGVILVLVSAIFYLVQINVFGRVEDTFFYMLQDLAFVPVQVLLVTLFLNELFKKREKAELQKKMNMVIGAFFGEVGTELVKLLMVFEDGSRGVASRLVFTKDWTGDEFTAAIKDVRAHDFAIDTRRGDLAALKGFLTEKRAFMLGLLENPNLLEHESFTELLWAVFHLTEELSRRDGVSGLPATDYEHLGGDVRRAYSLLLSEWLAYNSHLKADYPYIYSLVMRTNPFDPDARVEVG